MKEGYIPVQFRSKAPSNPSTALRKYPFGSRITESECCNYLFYMMIQNDALEGRHTLLSDERGVYDSHHGLLTTQCWAFFLFTFYTLDRIPSALRGHCLNHKEGRGLSEQCKSSLSMEMHTLLLLGI